MTLRLLALRLLPFAFFLALSLPHHPFSRWLDAEFIIPYGFETMQFVADIGTYLLILMISVAAIILHRRLGRGVVYHAGFWIVAGLAMYAVDRTLIVNNIERIHFPQYAAIALFLGLSLRGENLIFLAASFAGFADEFLQFSMNPQRTSYLDFNDIVLNILGAGLGVALLIAFRHQTSPGASSYERRMRTGLLAAVASIAGLVIFAGGTGRLIPVADVATNRSVIAEVNGKLSFILGFERHEDFWITLDYGKVFHILTPTEGTLVIGFLVVLFLISFRWLKGSKGGANRPATGASNAGG